ncbi:MAG: DUF4360 domain-containing protein [Oligoflexus sp.]
MQRRWLMITLAGISWLMASPSFSTIVSEHYLSPVQTTEPVYREPLASSPIEVDTLERRLCGQAAKTYLMNLTGLGQDFINDWGDVQLIEFSGGYAYLVGQTYRRSDEGQFAEFAFYLSQRSGAYPEGRYSYANLNGRLYVQAANQSYDFAVNRSGQAFLVGPGANLVNRAYGASAAFSYQTYGKAGRGHLQMNLGSCDQEPPAPKPVQPENWDVKILSSAGSACPVGSDTAVLNVADSGDVSLLMPGLQVEGNRLSRKFCQLALDVVRPKAWQFAIKKISYAYDANLDAETTANIVASSYFQASPETVMFRNRLQGPLNENRRMEQEIAYEDLNFSDCDGSRALNYKLAVDSRGTWADVQVSEKTVLKFVWRKCE